MGRGIQKWTEEKILELQRQGRGRGDGPKYQPWRKVGDFYSQGTTSELPSHRFGRAVHLFSQAEENIFLLLERANNVEQVREQFPLDRRLTQETAHSLGIAHQFYPKTNVPLMMTIDFLVDFKDADGQEYQEAWSAKCADQSDWLFTLEQEEILRASCSALGVQYRLVIDKLVPKSIVMNLSWIRRAFPDLELTNFDAGYWHDHQIYMLQELADRKPNCLLGAFCQDYDKRNGAKEGTAIRTLRILLACRALQMDLHNPNQEMAHMSCFHLAERASIHRFTGA